MNDQDQPPVGFNSQTYYDPFFPANQNGSNEQLVPVAAHHPAPTPATYAVPAAPHILKSNDADLDAAPTAAITTMTPASSSSFTDIQHQQVHQQPNYHSQQQQLQQQQHQHQHSSSLSPLSHAHLTSASPDDSTASASMTGMRTEQTSSLTEANDFVGVLPLTTAIDTSSSLQPTPQQFGIPGGYSVQADPHDYWTTNSYLSDTNPGFAQPIEQHEHDDHSNDVTIVGSAPQYTLFGAEGSDTQYHQHNPELVTDAAADLDSHDLVDARLYSFHNPLQQDRHEDQRETKPSISSTTLQPLAAAGLGAPEPAGQGDDDHRTSVGTANLSSSHLMSPVLTEAPDSSTREATASPALDWPDDRPRSRPSASAAAHLRVNTVYQAHQAAAAAAAAATFTQHTPTTTDRSAQASPALSGTCALLGQVSSPALPLDQPHPRVKRAREASGELSPTAPVPNQNTMDFHDASDDHDRFHQRTAPDPAARNQLAGAELPTLHEQQAEAQRVMKIADVEEWLDNSTSGSDAGVDSQPDRPKDLSSHQRARSSGAQALSTANLHTLETAVINTSIPGSGAPADHSSQDEQSNKGIGQAVADQMIAPEDQESSGDDDDDDNENDVDEDEDAEAASIDDSPIATPTEGLNDVPGEARPGIYDELPNQPPLFRTKLWQDPLYDSSDPGIKMQPLTSNEAMMRFHHRAADLESMSRRGTWGSRRLSESDMASLYRRLTITSTGEDKIDAENAAIADHAKRSSNFFQQAAARLVPKRTISLRRKESDREKKKSRSKDRSRSSSGGSRKENGLSVPQTAGTSMRRMGSHGKRPRSPRTNTGNAVAAMAGQMAAMGSSSPLTGASAANTANLSTPSIPWNMRMRRSRSRSDMTQRGCSGQYSSSATELSLPNLWTKSEVTSNAVVPPMRPLKLEDQPVPPPFGNFEEDDDEDGMDDHAVTMDLSIKPDTIVPTLDGFKANVRQLNPRLPPFMFDRIAQEQLRRFKKLMDFKIRHAQAISMGRCASGNHCTGLGGEPTYMPSKLGRDTSVVPSEFAAVSACGPSDDDASALADGIVTPAQFPPGVPMPPVRRLPAEFECSLCFKVKKFHKPSDWSKHVHEDVQPFTCTFQSCAEPKSFKRKADWVRHENERHRQLEWWQCNMNDCSHKCYRKDNFVQHLVREHKLPEPKIKTAKAGKPAVRGPSTNKARSGKLDDNGLVGEDSPDEVDQVWRLVEECRHETPKNPKDEPCKFCGSVCNSWKKLTVHLAKHMEQISMPVLSVVKTKEVTPDTIISPIDTRITHHPTSMSPISTHGSNGTRSSPYGMDLHGGGVGMPDLPGTFMTLPSQGNAVAGGTGYYADQIQQQHQHQQQQQQQNSQHVYQQHTHTGRMSSNTYPPPTNMHTPQHHQQQQHNHGQAQSYTAYGHPSPYLSSSPSVNNSYTPYRSSPSSQFQGMSNQRALSPEDMYAMSVGVSVSVGTPNGIRNAPTSQPRGQSPYDDQRAAFTGGSSSVGSNSGGSYMAHNNKHAHQQITPPHQGQFSFTTTTAAGPTAATPTPIPAGAYAQNMVAAYGMSVPVPVNVQHMGQQGHGGPASGGNNGTAGAASYMDSMGMGSGSVGGGGEVYGVYH